MFMRKQAAFIYLQRLVLMFSMKFMYQKPSIQASLPVLWANATVYTRLAHGSGPPTARQGYAIPMAYHWRVVGGPTLC